MSHQLVFVIDTAPLDDRDFERTIHKVRQVVRELAEDGVQVKPNYGMAVREVREAILAPFQEKAFD